MKESTKERYKEHTITRYNDRFSNLYGVDLYMTDEDYYKLCEKCKKTDNFKKLSKNTSVTIFKWIPENLSNRKIRKYKKYTYICCIFSKKTGLIKTVYPSSIKKYEKIKNNV